MTARRRLGFSTTSKLSATGYRLRGIAISIHGPQMSCFPNPRKYYNHKGFFAICVQAWVSASYKITYVSTMHAGSTHDSTAFMSGSLRKHLSVPEKDGGLPSWARIAADNAYGNGAAGGRVLTLYAGSLTPRQDNFNYYLSSPRIMVEQRFGVIVGRFGILWSPMRCTLSKSSLIIAVCCKIHNYIVDQRIARDGDDADCAGLSAGGDPDNDVQGDAEVLHCVPDVALHIRQGDVGPRETMADYLQYVGFIRQSRRRE
jgi:DDE superfamily endonuclease